MTPELTAQHGSGQWLTQNPHNCIWLVQVFTSPSKSFDHRIRARSQNAARWLAERLFSGATIGAVRLAKPDHNPTTQEQTDV